MPVSRPPIGATLLTGPVALAQDAPSPGPAAAVTTVTLDELGRGSLALPTTGTPSQLSVPVPDGLTPQQLTTTVRLPLLATQGVLAVSAGAFPLGRYDVSATGTAVTVALQTAPVVDRAITLTITAALVDPAGTCTRRTDQALTLAGGQLTYTGTEATPTTPVAFFPPVLRAATVYLTDPTNPAQRATALSTSTALTHRYGQARTTVRLAELAPGQPVPPSAPLERAVVLRSGAAAGVRVETGRNDLLATDQHCLAHRGPRRRVMNSTRAACSARTRSALVAAAVRVRWVRMSRTC